MKDPRELAELLAAVSAGRAGAEDELYERVYADLRILAQRQLGGGRGAPTLGTTALVHETYLKLVDRSRISPHDRAHFFATAARAMRQIIVDYVRMVKAEKRGGADPKIHLDEVAELLSVGSNPDEQAATILAVDSALHLLDEKNPRLRQVVELRFFAGFDVEETAEILNSSPRTVKRDWQIARAFLYNALNGDGPQA